MDGAGDRRVEQALPASSILSSGPETSKRKWGYGVDPSTSFDQMFQSKVQQPVCSLHKMPRTELANSKPSSTSTAEEGTYKVATKSKTKGTISRGGRPTTWIGGGGLDPESLVGLGVPKLRALFLEVFGFHTASNNGAWLRRKLTEPADPEYGVGRSSVVRARDQQAAIWTTGNIKTITQAEAQVRSHRGKPGVISLKQDRKRRELPIDAESQTPTPVVTPRASPTKLQQAAVLRPGRAVKLDYGVPELKDVQKLVQPRTLVTFQDVTPELVGCKVELYWPDDRTWWPGQVLKIDTETLWCHVAYDEGSTEDLNLHDVISSGHMSLCSPLLARPPVPAEDTLALEWAPLNHKPVQSSGYSGDLLRGEDTQDVASTNIGCGADLAAIMHSSAAETANNSAGFQASFDHCCDSSSFPSSPDNEGAQSLGTNSEDGELSCLANTLASGCDGDADLNFGVDIFIDSAVDDPVAWDEENAQQQCTGIRLENNVAPFDLGGFGLHKLPTGRSLTIQNDVMLHDEEYAACPHAVSARPTDASAHKVEFPFGYGSFKFGNNANYLSEHGFAPSNFWSQEGNFLKTIASPLPSLASPAFVADTSPEVDPYNLLMSSTGRPTYGHSGNWPSLTPI